MRLLPLLTTALIVAISCKEKPKKYPTYHGPMVMAETVNTVYSDSGRKRVVLTAPLQQEWATGNRTFPRGIQIQFYDAAGNPESKLTANKGFFDKMTEIYTARGNVQVENTQEKRKLKSEELKWSRFEKRVYTDKFVRIETPEETLFGDGLTAAQDFKTYKILKLRGTIPVNKL